MLGVQTFAGYLLTAPFFAGGDVGKILPRAERSGWLTLLVALVGIVGVLAVSWFAVGLFFRLMPITPKQPTDLRLFLRQIAVLPWLLGSVLVILAALPLDNPFGPLAVATSGLFSLVAMGLTARRLPLLADPGARDSEHGLILLVVLAVVALLLNLLVFRGGLRI